LEDKPQEITKSKNPGHFDRDFLSLITKKAVVFAGFLRCEIPLSGLE
jgi:hypothetical protein